MSGPNKDEVEGKWEQAKGWVKDKTRQVRSLTIPNWKPKVRLKTRPAKARKLGVRSKAVSATRLIASEKPSAMRATR